MASTLYLDRKGLTVKLDGRALAFYEGDRRTGSVPLALLSRIVIRAETRLTSRVLGAIAEAGVSLVVLSGRHGKRLALVQGRPHNDAAVRLAQYACCLDLPWRLNWSRSLVAAKISRQLRFLRQALAERPEKQERIRKALRTLRPLLVRVRSEACSLDSLRGLEGAAQAAYFRGYAPLFPPSLNFRRRNRRPPRDPVNACLSLVYTLAHYEACRVSYELGLDPFLGFFHDPAFGRESLACDLIEPLRPGMDAWVWDLFRRRVLRGEHFLENQGACFLGKRGRSLFYQEFDGFLIDLNRRLRAACRLLVRQLRDQARERLQPLWEECR